MFISKIRDIGYLHNNIYLYTYIGTGSNIYIYIYEFILAAITWVKCYEQNPGTKK